MSYGSILCIPQLTSNCSTGALQKSLSLNKKYLRILRKKFRRKGQQAEKDRKGNRTRQKNKRGDSKVESNDSPEIPDRGETSDIPGISDKQCNHRKAMILSEVMVCVCVCVCI